MTHIVVVNPESPGGLVIDAGDGVTYAVYCLAMDSKPGVPLQTPTTFGALKGYAIHVFESQQAALEWMAKDCDERTAWTH